MNCLEKSLSGAISWMCPVPYLLNTGLPALRTAVSHGHSNPSLVAHVIVALSQDRHSVLAAGHQLLDMATKLPFYIKMFADAGFPLNPGQKCQLTDNLVDSLVISANKVAITARFTELLAAGLDELMVSLTPMSDAGDEQTRLMRVIGLL